MKKYILTLVLMCVTSTAVVPAGPKGLIEDTLTDLPEASRLVEFYKNNTRLIHAAIVVASAALVYLYNQNAVNASIKKLFGFDSRKDACGCGCSLECACRSGEGNVCSINAACGNTCGSCCSMLPSHGSGRK